jgi:hypothetical protein
MAGIGADIHTFGENDALPAPPNDPPIKFRNPPLFLEVRMAPLPNGGQFVNAKAITNWTNKIAVFISSRTLGSIDKYNIDLEKFLPPSVRVPLPSTELQLHRSHTIDSIIVCSLSRSSFVVIFSVNHPASLC